MHRDSPVCLVPLLSPLSGLHRGVWERVPRDEHAGAVAGSVPVPPARRQLAAGPLSPAEAGRRGDQTARVEAAGVRAARSRVTAGRVVAAARRARGAPRGGSPWGRACSRAGTDVAGSDAAVPGSVAGETALQVWLPGAGPLSLGRGSDLR